MDDEGSETTPQTRYEKARLEMRDAFVDMGMLALRAGVDQDSDDYLNLHGRFFDAHVQLKEAIKEWKD